MGSRHRPCRLWSSTIPSRNSCHCARLWNRLGARRVRTCCTAYTQADRQKRRPALMHVRGLASHPCRVMPTCRPNRYPKSPAKTDCRRHNVAHHYGLLKNMAGYETELHQRVDEILHYFWDPMASLVNPMRGTNIMRASRTCFRFLIVMQARRTSRPIWTKLQANTWDLVQTQSGPC
jgi:hypothetical protein